MSELRRLAKTTKGRAFLLEEVEIMEWLSQQVRVALGEAPPPPGSVPESGPRRRGKRPRTNRAPEGSGFDGTLASLCDAYRAGDAYQRLRHATRGHYDQLMKRIVEDYGRKRLDEMKPSHIDQFYEGWKADGKSSMGHALMTMLRTLIYFGTSVLEDRECERLSVVLRRMRLDAVKPRSGDRLTATQAAAIIKKAHEMDLSSIALAQAFQWDLKLRQKDVIGEWVPESEPVGHSEIIKDGQKWIRGLLWSEIDGNLVLRHRTISGDVKFDLNKAQLVMDELQKIGSLPSVGPIIVCESTGRPYSSIGFRRAWRRVADKAGVPKSVKNTDSRMREDDEIAATSGEIDNEGFIGTSDGMTSEARH